MNGLDPAAMLHVSTLPVILPFSAQLNSVNGFVRMCQQQPRPDFITLAHFGQTLDRTIFRPNGMALPDIHVIDDPQNIPSFVDEVRSLSRDMFDPQISGFSSKRLSDQLVVEEHLNYAGIFDAIGLGTVSEGPAGAFIKSLEVYNRDRNRYTGAKLSSVLFLAAGALTLFYPLSDFVKGGWTVEGVIPSSLFLLMGIVSGTFWRVYHDKIAPIFKPSSLT